MPSAKDEMFNAWNAGDSRRAMQLMSEHDISPNANTSPFGLGTPVLAFATRNNDHHAIRQLLEEGADVHKRDLYGKPIMHHAKDAESISLLIAKGADIDARASKENYVGDTAIGSTALHRAVQHGDVHIARALIAAGANPNALDKNGATPLHHAAKVNRELYDDLLKAGADPSIRAKDTEKKIGHTPAELADQYLNKNPFRTETDLHIQGRAKDQLSEKSPIDLLGTVPDKQTNTLLSEIQQKAGVTATQPGQTLFTLTADGSEPKAFSSPNEAANAFKAADAKSRPSMLQTNEQGTVTIGRTNEKTLNGETFFEKVISKVNKVFEKAFAEPSPAPLPIEKTQVRQANTPFVRQNLERGFQMENTQGDNVRLIGAKLQKPQFLDATKFLGGDPAKVFLPKAGGEYDGKVLYATETHILQQVGKKSIVAHDISKLENGKELIAQYDKGQLDRKQIKVNYGQDKGAGEVVPFNVKRAQEVKSELVAFAENSIKNVKARESFLKHAESFTAWLEKGGAKTAQSPAIASPTRQKVDQERVR